ncbi:MAG: hypothetical protein M1609_04215 [Firmicutes bacterium]|nr:hypothetical protein [Bacillota bacterium]
MALFKKASRWRLFYLVNAAFLLVWFLYFIPALNHPYIGIEIQPNAGGWIVVQSDPNGVGYQSGIRAGDLIVEVNRQRPDRFPLVQSWGEVEGARSLKVVGAGDTTRVIDMPSAQSWATMLSVMPMPLLGMLFWLIGCLTWIKRSYLIQARNLFWLNLFLGLAIVLAPASGRLLFGARELESVSFSLASAYLVKFISVFPEQRENKANAIANRVMLAIFLTVMTVTGLKLLGILTSIIFLTGVMQLMENSSSINPKKFEDTIQKSPKRFDIFKRHP